MGERGYNIVRCIDCDASINRRSPWITWTGTVVLETADEKDFVADGVDAAGDAVSVVRQRTNQLSVAAVVARLPLTPTCSLVKRHKNSVPMMKDHYFRQYLSNHHALLCSTVSISLRIDQ